MSNSNDNETDRIFGSRDALIIDRSVEIDTAALTTLVKNSRAFDVSIFEEENSAPFFWPAECSSNRIDSYFTRMAKTSLTNYAQDLSEGIAFQPNHNHRTLPLGSSLTSKYTGGQGNGVSTVRGEFYTVPGLRISDINTDDFIRGVRTGLIRDVSIGFYGGRFICNICSEDMLRSWDCWHFPGFKYDVKDKKGNVVEKDKLCIADVEDAHLAEVSAVYDGATPGAVILKAQQRMESGKVKPDLLRVLESRYRVKLIGAQPFQGHRDQSEAKPDKPAEESTMNTQRLQDETDEQFVTRVTKEITDEINAQNLADKTARETEYSDLSTLLTDAAVPEASTLKERVEKIVDEARDGRKYREDVIEETLRQGKRAHSDKFKAEAYRKMLERSSIEEIRQMCEDLKAVGDKNFPTGRASTDEVSGEQPNASVTKVPESAYKAGRKS